MARIIRPSLGAGAWVVCDRFTDSTIAYQGFGLGADRKVIASLAGLIGLDPDLTLVLDVSEAVAASRLAALIKKPDRYERLSADFHARVRRGFREIAKANPARCRLIDGDATLRQVQGRVIAVVDEFFGVDGRA